MIYLLAYPRSGSSYVRYLLGFLTESKPMQPQGHCEIDHLLSKYYKKDPFIKKFHYPKDGNLSINMNIKDKLVLLKRNPIENTLSFMFSNEFIGKKNQNDNFIGEYINETLKNNKKVFEKYGNSYKKNINFFNSIKNEKIIISYEEIINNPKNELKRLSNFFGYNKNRVDILMNDFSYHKNLMLNHKTQKNDPFNVNTKGEKIDKFFNLLNEENKEYINNFFKL